MDATDRQLKAADETEFAAWEAKLDEFALLSKSKAYLDFRRRVTDRAGQVEGATYDLRKLLEEPACQIDELKKARVKEVKKIDAADLSLRAELMMIEPPEKTKSNEKEFAKLPGFTGEVVEKGGVPLGRTDVVLKPDVGFDLKAGKLKNFGIEIKLEW